MRGLCNCLYVRVVCISVNKSNILSETPSIITNTRDNIFSSHITKTTHDINSPFHVLAEGFKFLFRVREFVDSVPVLENGYPDFGFHFALENSRITYLLFYYSLTVLSLNAT
jgi:hypothetical protein